MAADRSDNSSAICVNVEHFRNLGRVNVVVTLHEKCKICSNLIFGF